WQLPKRSSCSPTPDGPSHRVRSERRMPELPEVETVRRGLGRLGVGRGGGAVESGRLRTVRRTSAQAVVDGLTGSTIVAANRRGKYLLIPLDNGDEGMIHWRRTGNVR